MEEAERLAVVAAAGSHLLATMSRELRTPLNAIIGALLMSPGYAEIDPQQRRSHVADTDDGSTHLPVLTSDMRDRSELETDHPPLIEEALDREKLPIDCAADARGRRRATAPRVLCRRLARC